jgi:hypothetical protein
MTNENLSEGAKVIQMPNVSSGDGLPELTPEEKNTIQKFMMAAENLRLQMDNYVLQLMLKYKIDPQKYGFSYQEGKFIELGKQK